MKKRPAVQAVQRVGEGKLSEQVRQLGMIDGQEAQVLLLLVRYSPPIISQMHCPR